MEGQGQGRHRTIDRNSDEYWGLFECPPRLPPGWVTVGTGSSSSEEEEELESSRRQRELCDLNKYSGQMVSGSATLLRAQLPFSLPESLLRREIGSPNSAMITERLQGHIVHKLIAARAPCDSSSTVGALEHNLTLTPRQGQIVRPQDTIRVQAGRVTGPPTSTKKKWSRISCSMSSGVTPAKYKLTFVADLLMMKDGTRNTRRFLQPNGPLFSNSSPYNIQFSIEDGDMTKLKWKDHDIRLFNMHNPRMEGVNGATATRKVAKIPNSLLVLESTGKLLRYDFNTGKKMEELDLGYPGGPQYSTLVIDHAVGKGGIIVIANSGAAKKSNPGLILEFLIISSYPRLKVSHRLLFPKLGEYGLVDDVTLFGDLMITSKPSAVEFFDLNQVLALNPVQKCEDVGSLERIVLIKKPESLGRFKTKDGYFRVIDGAHPPTICVKSNDIYEIRCLDKPDEILGEIGSKSHEGDVILEDYDSKRPRLLVSGLLHGFDILHVDTKGKTLKLLYSTKSFEDEDQESLTPQGQGSSISSDRSSVDTTPKRQGLRQLVKKNYADLERAKCFGYGYLEDLELFAVCLVVDGTLKTTILNNETLAPVRRLSSVKLSSKKGVTSLGCSTVSVQFNEGHIMVKLCLFDTEKSGGTWTEVYTANLIGEVVPLP